MRYFRFYDEEQEKSHYLELVGPQEKLDMPVEDLDELFYSIIQPEMENRSLEEKYGIHDVSYGTNTLTLWGFTTYEVDSKMWPDLMMEWRAIWQLAGFEVGSYFIKVENAEDQL
jgi:hypothetical protein